MRSIAVKIIYKACCRESRGFTLIELTASMVLLAMLAAIFGLGIAGALKVYAISEENVHLAQKGQIAMARINRELMELTAVVARNDNDDDNPFIVYENLRGTGVHAIRFDSTAHQLLLYSDLPAGTTALDINGNNDILLNNVADFNISYFQGTDKWEGINQRHLSHIQTYFSLMRTRGVLTNTEDFTSLVYLRNTLNYGGAAPSSEPPEIPGMGGYNCFITASIPADGKIDPTPIRVLPVMVLIMTISRRFRFPGKTSKHPSGSALIAVIAALLIFSTIAAALLPLVGSSGHQTVAQDHAEKAYLLAESGFRYAAGEYINAGSDADKLQLLGNLHNSHFTTTGRGRFALQVHTYFFEVREAASGTTLHATAHGAIPPEIESLASQNNLGLRITTGTQILMVRSISVNGLPGSSGRTVTFRLAASIQDTISQGTLIFPAASPAGNFSLVNGGTIAASNLDMFPARNGYITMAGRRLNYRYRTANGLVGVVDLNDPDMHLTIADTDDIMLNRHVQLVSTGFYGSEGFQARRTITYDTPLYFNGLTERTTIEDTFNDLSNWNSVWGNNTIENRDGNRRLKVAGEMSPAAPEAGLIALDSDEAKTALRAAYASSGFFLSYDTQVKVGFDPDEDPNSDYFAAGLSFRLKIDTDEGLYNSYGVSIMRGNPLNSEDLINNAIVPEATADKMAIVLWRQTDNGADSSWVAYKIIENDDGSHWPIRDATLLVRVKEAVVLEFSVENHHNDGAIPIQKGNLIIGDESGARGRVIQGPILSSGSAWTSYASGYLLLNNISGHFEDGEGLRVVGRGVLANVNTYSGRRTNIIRVYFGRSGAAPETDTCEDEEDGGTPTALDETMICYPIGTSPLVWPPDLDDDGTMDWPAGEDYFQLVQWEGRNTGVIIADSFDGPDSSDDLEPDAIVIHHDPDLQTPEDGDISDRAEIGIHAFGAGTENVYFDDFGLQLTSRVPAVIPPPIQH
jgi:prepilin-type N-terminal cleavage/methylation domain-containing protein